MKPVQKKIKAKDFDFAGFNVLFHFSSGISVGYMYSDPKTPEKAAPHLAVSEAPFGEEDIKNILHSEVWEGDYAEESRDLIVELKDGRFAYLTSGCDTTGYGCRDWGNCIIADTFNNLMLFGIEESRRNKYCK